MCRIYGYISNGFDGLDRKVSAVSNAQIHGGPDSQTAIVTPTYAIGCNRLAITDPAGGGQPYAHEHGIYVVLNGEIYNHEDIRRELETDGYRIPDRCDGSILPALYDKYGASFPEYLDGMFSIAILDLRQGEPTLFLATDTSGIKPLYFSSSSDTQALAFSTEVTGLLKFGVASNRLWVAGVDHYLTTRCVTGLRTNLEDVYSLPPGSLLIKKRGRDHTITSYSSRIRFEGTLPKTMNEAGGVFRELLDSEIKKLSRADANICSVNSGGLDSSFITALFCRGADEQKSTFHVACEGKWPFDERGYAQDLANAYSTTHHEVMVNPNFISDIIPKMVRHLGLPNCAPHSLSTYILFSAVAQKGFRVALTGEGSDELFCGHDRMKAAIQHQGDDWISAYLDKMSACKEKTRHSLYASEYLAYLDSTGGSAKEEMINVIRSVSTDRSMAIRHFEQKYSLPYYILHRVEPLAMASGVEVRVPFCQPKIMDFSWKINNEFFLQNEGRGKAIVYEAARGLIPESIFSRPKQPFTLPIISLMHKGSPLMSYVRDMLSTRRWMEIGIFNPDKLAALIEEQENTPNKESAFTLWGLLTYAVWLDVCNEEAIVPASFCEDSPYISQHVYDEQRRAAAC